MYSKPHLSVDDQLELLKSRGVICSDDDYARRVLQAVGYYRFSGYLHPFRLPDPAITDGSHRLDQVEPLTQFDDVVALLRYDRCLRCTLLDGLQLVEIAIRTRVSDVLGLRDAFGHLQRSSLDLQTAARLSNRHGVDKTAFEWWQDEYSRLEKRAKDEAYVAHNLTKYGPPLPIWIASEFLDFGATVNLVQLLKYDDRQAISRAAGLSHERTLRSWLSVLNYVRNACAHNSRIWNRRLIRKPQMRRADLPTVLRHAAGGYSDKIYPVIAITAYLTSRMISDARWARDMKALLLGFPQIPLRSIAEMGVPATWVDEALWKDT